MSANRLTGFGIIAALLTLTSGAAGDNPSQATRTLIADWPAHMVSTDAPRLRVSGEIHQNALWQTTTLDLNGDGIDDLVMANPLASPLGREQAGMVHVLFGRADNRSDDITLDDLDATDGFTLTGPAPGARLGWAMAATGRFSVKGDATLIIGAPGDNESPAAWPGGVFLLHAKAASSGSPATTNIDLAEPEDERVSVIRPPADSGLFGYAVAGLSDFNGDGFADIAIGDPAATVSGQQDAGRVHVVYGGQHDAPITPDTLAFDRQFQLQGHRADLMLGISLAEVADFNDDGLTDLVIGAPGGPADAHDRGAFLIPGQAASLDAAIGVNRLDELFAYHIRAPLGDEAFGQIVASRGGAENAVELLIAAPKAGVDGMAAAGRVHVLAVTGDRESPIINPMREGMILEGSHTEARLGLQMKVLEPALAGNKTPVLMASQERSATPDEHAGLLFHVFDSPSPLPRDTANSESAAAGMTLVTASQDGKTVSPDWHLQPAGAVDGRYRLFADTSSPGEHALRLITIQSNHPVVNNGNGIEDLSVLGGNTLTHQFQLDPGAQDPTELILSLNIVDASQVDISGIEINRVSGQTWEFIIPTFANGRTDTTATLEIDHPNLSTPVTESFALRIAEEPFANIFTTAVEIIDGATFELNFTIDSGGFPYDDLNINLDVTPQDIFDMSRLELRRVSGDNWVALIPTLVGSTGTGDAVVSIEFPDQPTPSVNQTPFSIFMEPGTLPTVNNGLGFETREVFAGRPFQEDFTVDPGQFSNTQISVLALMDDTSLIQADSLEATGGGNDWQISFDTISGQFGATQTTARVYYQTGPEAYFVRDELIVNITDGRPVINSGNALSVPPIYEGQSDTVAFLIEDPDTSLSNVDATSNNQTLLPNGDLVIEPIGGDQYELTINTTPGNVGSVNATVAATNALGTRQTSFPVNIQQRPPPTINGGAGLAPDWSVQSGQSLSINFDVDDIIDPPGDLAVNVQSLTPSVLADANLSLVDLGGGQWRLDIETDVADEGSADVQIDVSNSAGRQLNETINVVINARQPPTINAGGGIANQSVRAGQTLEFTVTLADDIDAPDDISLTAQSGNTSVLPNSAITLAGTGAERTVRIETNLNQSGNVGITLSATNTAGLTTNEAFQLNILQRLAPTINGGAGVDNQSVLAGQDVEITVIVADDVDPPANISLTAQSDNTSVLPNSAIALSGTGAERTIVIQTDIGQSGNAPITLTATNSDGLSSSESFQLAIQQRLPPTINGGAGIADQTVRPGDPVVVSITLADQIDAPDDIDLSAQSANQTRLPDSALELSGSGALRTLTIDTSSLQSGDVGVSVTATNSDGLTSTDGFRVIIVNRQPPSINLGAGIDDQSVQAGQLLQVAFSASDGNSPPEAVSISAFSGAPALLPNNALSISRNGNDFVLDIQTETGRTGSVPIVVTATNESGLSAQAPFQLAIQNVPPPNIEPQENLSDLTMVLGQVRNIVLELSDPQDPPDALSISAESGNTSVLANDALSFSGTGAQRVLTIDTQGATLGSTPITLTVVNSRGGTDSLTFTLSIVQQSTQLELDDERLATGGGEDVFLALGVENIGSSSAFQLTLGASVDGDLEIVGAFSLAEDCDLDASEVRCDPDQISPWVCSVSNNQMQCHLDELPAGERARGVVQLRGTGFVVLQANAAAGNAPAIDSQIEIEN